MSKIFKRANDLSPELIAMRRYLHQRAETGFDLPQTIDYIIEKLTEFGYEPQQIGKGGVVATVGKKNGDQALLLRADMDALPMEEKSGLDFASQTGNVHSCGHDIHAASLLGAAKILKEMEDELRGTVKLLFQPAEELLTGASEMIRAGVLENPKVEAAFGMHVASYYPVKQFGYNRATTMASCDNFEITITGRSCHGSMPHFGIDPINVGCHIHTALQEIISREIDASEAAVITVGQFIAGTAVNVIPETAILRGTMRARSKGARELMLRRMKEIVRRVAEAFNATVNIEMLVACPPLTNDAQMCDMFLEMVEEFNIEGVTFTERNSMGSEDFSVLAEAVPSFFGFFGGALADESKRFPAHNPQIVFDEACLPYGAAVYAAFAEKWLNQNK